MKIIRPVCKEILYAQWWLQQAYCLNDDGDNDGDGKVAEDGSNDDDDGDAGDGDGKGNVDC